MAATKDYNDLLQPDIISTIRGLSLISKVVVDKYLSGLNVSRRKGSGMEFSQYRGYEPGDDLRLLDWKMLARSGKYFIKQSEVDTHTTIKFIIDASASMMHTEAALSKLSYVQVLVASLAYLSKSQGDAIGLYAMNESKTFHLSPSSQSQQFNRFLQQLISVNAEGKWPVRSAAASAIHSRKEREMIVVFTDLYETKDELSSYIASLKTPRNEVIVIHVLGEQEFKFNFKGTLVFEDLESGEQVKVASGKAKELYLQALDEKVKKHQQHFLTQAVSYEQFMMGQPIENVLSTYLKRRLKFA